jgi:hypothetical protein
MRLLLQSIAAGAVASAAVAMLFAEINMPVATAIDAPSAMRGSLGASLEDLSPSSDLGKLSLLLNGGFGLLFGAFAVLAVASRRREPINQLQHRGGDRSAHSMHST